MLIRPLIIRHFCSCLFSYFVALPPPRDKKISGGGLFHFFFFDFNSAGDPPPPPRSPHLDVRLPIHWGGIKTGARILKCG